MRSPYIRRLMGTCRISYRGKREGDEKNRVKSNTFVSILRPYSRPLSGTTPVTFLVEFVLSPVLLNTFEMLLSTSGVTNISTDSHVTLVVTLLLCYLSNISALILLYFLFTHPHTQQLPTPLHTLVTKSVDGL